MSVHSGSRRASLRRGEPVFAALDPGANNCRLLVARREHRRDHQRGQDPDFRIVDSFSRIVRLGEGVEASGALSEAAMARTIGALMVCAEKIRGAGISEATGSRCVATQACRQAANGGEFVERARRETGLDLEIISPSEEARLIVEGCLPLLHGETSRALREDILIGLMEGGPDGGHREKSRGGGIAATGPEA